MSNNEQSIKDIQTLLNKYFESKSSEGRFSDARDPAAAKLPIYLPFDSCPSGLVPCDESMGNCPSDEYAVNPPIYTTEGHRCYTKQGVARSRLSSKDKDVVVKGIRALVANVAKLRDANVELDRIIKESAENPEGSVRRLYELYKKQQADANLPANDFNVWLATNVRSTNIGGRVITEKEKEFMKKFLQEERRKPEVRGGYDMESGSEYDMESASEYDMY